MRYWSNLRMHRGKFEAYYHCPSTRQITVCYPAIPSDVRPAEQPAVLRLTGKEYCLVDSYVLA